MIDCSEITKSAFDAQRMGHDSNRMCAHCKGSTSLNERVLVLLVEFVEFGLQERQGAFLDEQMGVVQVTDDEFVSLLGIEPKQKLFDRNITGDQEPAKRADHPTSLLNARTRNDSCSDPRTLVLLR